MNRANEVWIVVGLLGLSTLMQVASIAWATTTELDAVRFAAMAQSIDRLGVLETVRAEGEQPLFPLWVWVVHEGLGRAQGEATPTWATSVQVAAAVPLVLAVVPLFLLLRRLVGNPAATAGSLLFCLLPTVARLGADGLSDSTHLLLLCVAFWAMVEYLERPATVGGRASADRAGSPWWLLLAGAAVALAALARAEVLVLAAAFWLTLAGFQCVPRRRVAWRNLAAATGCFLLGLAIAWGPYLTATGAATPRAAVARLLGRRPTDSHATGSPLTKGATTGLSGRGHEDSSEHTAGQASSGTSNSSIPPSQRVAGPDEGNSAADWRLPDGEAMSFAPKDPSVSARRRGLGSAIGRLGQRLADASGYWIGILALWGAWRLGRPGAGYRPGGRATAGDRLVQVFFVLYCLAVLRFSAREGYLESRHLLALVVAGLGSAGLGALDLGALLGRAVGLRRTTGAAWALVALAGVSCLPLTAGLLHDDRLGHRQAAEWLATEADAPGPVLDTLGWTGLYSGRPTYLYTAAANALNDPGLAYLVLERREAEYDSRRGRTLQWLVDSGGEQVAEFPLPTGEESSRPTVVVYRWHPDRLLSEAEVAAAEPTVPVEAGGAPICAVNTNDNTYGVLFRASNDSSAWADGLGGIALSDLIGDGLDIPFAAGSTDEANSQ